jgi:hypothetical protein
MPDSSQLARERVVFLRKSESLLLDSGGLVVFDFSVVLVGGKYLSDWWGVWWLERWIQARTRRRNPSNGSGKRRIDRCGQVPQARFIGQVRFHKMQTVSSIPKFSAGKRRRSRITALILCPVSSKA